MRLKSSIYTSFCPFFKEVVCITISKRIFDLLDQRGLTNADLARGTGISARTIGDWRRLGTNPSADKISCICDFLDVSADYLLAGKKISSPSLSLRDDELELLDYYNALSVLERGKILARMEDKVNNLKTDDLQGRVG